MAQKDVRTIQAELAAAERAVGQMPADIDGQMEEARRKITALKQQTANATL